MRAICLFFLILFGGSPSVMASFTYNASVKEVHKAIHALRWDDAASGLSALQKDTATNGFYHYLDHFRSSIDILISQDEAQYEAYLAASAAHRNAVQEIAETSPWKRYCLGEMHMYEAMVHARFRQMNKAALDVRSAYQLLEKNMIDHRDFAPGYKTLGLLEAGIGTLPSAYRKMIGLMGYTGTIYGGYAKIMRVTAIEDPDLECIVREAGYLKMAVELYLLNDRDKAWQTIRQYTGDYEENLLAAFFRANTAMKCGANDEAIQTLENRPSGDQYRSFHFMEYMLGSARLRKLDPAAARHFLTFISTQQEGDHIKSAYHKLTWYYILFPDEDKYLMYRKLTISRGNVSLEADKQALFEVIDGERPHPELLRVRCLFDGSYYDQAEAIIRPMREKDFNLMEHRIEYNYRKGRVFQMQGDTSLARAFYLEAITRGRNAASHTYYAAYSAYYIGLMYEERGDQENAESYFRMAIDLGKSTNFEKSIEHKAKSALTRMKKNSDW